MTLDTISSFWKSLVNTILHGTALRKQRAAASSHDVGAELAADGKNAPEPGLPAAARVMFLAGLLTALSLAAFAQPADTSPGSLRLGPAVGFFKAQDADEAKAMWGAALRLKLTEAIGVEGSLHYRSEEYNQGAVSVKSWPVMVTGLIYPIPMLYGAIGAGWYNSSAEITLFPGATPITETHQDVGWHFGGGVELPLGSAATLVGDLRYVYLNYDFQNVPGSSSITSNFYVVDVSLLFTL